MDVDSQPTMEETILVGDDLMMGPPSPLIPPEIASHVLKGIDLCDGILRNLFLCLQINDIEPFCQDEIALYRQCAGKRDKELRQRLQDSEHKLGLSMPFDEAKERAAQLESEATSLERRLILASGIEGMEGFRQRWSLHGRLTDTKRRLEALKQGIENRKKTTHLEVLPPAKGTHLEVLPPEGGSFGEKKKKEHHRQQQRWCLVECQMDICSRDSGESQRGGSTLSRDVLLL